jgi:hypothetical protein
MKRKLKWIAVVLVVLVVGFGVALSLLPRDRITVESWKEIRIGMTEKEVERILGGPGISTLDFSYQLNESEESFNDDGIILAEPKGRTFGRNAYANGQRAAVEGTKVWWGRHGRISIQFDDDGNVSGKGFWGWRPTNPTFFERVRDWLGW